MHREMKTIRTIANEPGTISNSAHTSVGVYFDLVETRDFVDGIPDLEFSFGNLRFPEEADPRIFTLAQFRAPLVLSGGGIETTILLNGPNAFTVMSAVKEIQISNEKRAA
jgi:hypothetical protein